MSTELVRKSEEIRNRYYADVMSKLVERILDLEGGSLRPEELDEHTTVEHDAQGQTTWFWKGNPIVVASGPVVKTKHNGTTETSWTIRAAPRHAARSRIKIKAGAWDGETGDIQTQISAGFFRVRLDCGVNISLGEHEFTRL